MLCLLLFIILCSPVLSIALNKNEHYAQLKRNWIRSDFSSGHRDCKQIWVFGDSQVASSINPNYLDGNGYCFFNFGLVSHDINKASYIFEDAIRTGNRPYAVLIYPSYERNDFFLFGSYEEFSEYKVNSKFHDYLIEKYIGTPSIERIIRSLYNLINYKIIIERKNQIVTNRGVFWWGGDDTQLQGTNVVDKLVFDTSALWTEAYYEKVINFLNRVSMYTDKIYLFEPPQISSHYRNRNCIPRNYSRLMNDNLNLKMVSNDQSYILLSENYFFDIGHVNKNGSRVYSDYLKNKLRLNMDHKFIKKDGTICQN